MKLHGRPVSSGVAIGPVMCVESRSHTLSSEKAAPCQVEELLGRYEHLREKAKQELQALIDKFEGDKKPQAGIFRAQIDILYDVVMHDEIVEAVTRDLDMPDRAIFVVYSRYSEMIAGAKDPVIRERAVDLADVRDRLLRLWHRGAQQDEDALFPAFGQPVILAAKDLFPSDTAALDTSKVLAILTEQGSATSHTAILSRSHGIPAIVGLEGLMQAVHSGDQVIVDALEGVLDTAPDTQTLQKARQAKEAYAASAQRRKSYLYVPSQTADGVPVKVCLNVDSNQPEEFELAKAVDGVGLLRTEFLFMAGSGLPNEQQQYEAYVSIARRFPGRLVTVRTLDVGADKQIPALPLAKEENPALGLRALRLCFAHPQLFKTQLCAILRASAEGNIQIMFPMVASLDDIRRAKEYLEEAKELLRARRVPFNESIRVGVMIEIPVLAMIADQVAEEVDFASIGTNDLCQYLFAADRVNADVARYCQNLHPGLFRLIGNVAEAFRRQGKEISVCGEMAADTQSAAVLAGLGIHKLSVNQGCVAHIKEMLAHLTMKDAEKLARAVVRLGTEEEVKALLKQEL